MLDATQVTTAITRLISTGTTEEAVLAAWRTCSQT